MMLRKNISLTSLWGQSDDETLEELFKKLEQFRGKTKVIMIDGYKGYEKFIRIANEKFFHSKCNEDFIS